MRISIITEGFQNTGYGHITRCLSLYEAFEEKSIYPTLYINGDSKIKFIIEGTNYKLINWLDHPALLIEEINKSDIIIIDSYLANKAFYDNLASLCEIILIIDDYMRLDYSSGIILNGTINAETFPYPHRPNLEYLLGTKFIPVRKEFWNVNKRKFRKEIESILLTYGGQDVRGLIIPTVKAIKDYKPNLNMKVVIGNKPNDEATKLLDKYKYVEICHSLSGEEMKELMINCDIAISGAGQTLYELAATGTPTVAIEISDNQKYNISEWNKAGFVLDPICYNDIKFENKIIEQIERLRGIKIREKISKIGKFYVDGQGSRRVVNYLLDKLKK